MASWVAFPGWMVHPPGMRSGTLIPKAVMPLVVGLLGYLCGDALRARTADEFFTQRGSDPTFEQMMKTEKVPRGRNTTTGFTGSAIKINHELLKNSPDARRKIPDAIRIHTLGHSSIRRQDFPKWTRWYQEDGNTQVFRLFKDEVNVRNSRALAARVEAFSQVNWERGEWNEWVGTFTIIKPHSASIFQVMNSSNEWALHLSMNDRGDVSYRHRRGGGSKVIARNMVGKSFHIRVRDNGHDFELFLNDKSQGKGTYARPQGRTNFRWGMYLGANPVRHEAMILVTGAGVNVRDHKPGRARSLDTAEEKTTESPAEEESGLRIPIREWTNIEGVTVTAAALFEPVTDILKLWVGGEWVAYPLDRLAENDRKELLATADAAE